MNLRCKALLTIIICIASALHAGLLESRPVHAQGIGAFQRGDCNGDNLRDISDVVAVIQYIFMGASLSCSDACDTDDSGELDVNDIVFQLNQIFTGPISYPSPELCGLDPTLDELACEMPYCEIGTILAERVFTLESGRIGNDYLGELPLLFQKQVSYQVGMGSPVVLQSEIAFQSFGLEAHQLMPAGLSLNSNGTISGSPTVAGHYSLDFWAQLASGEYVQIHAQLAIFTEDQTEFIDGQFFDQLGSFSVAAITGQVPYLHELPNPPPYPLFNCATPMTPPADTLINKDILIVYPTNAPGPHPILFFHHATGFTYNDYDYLFAHLASHGIICCSIADSFSYEEYTDYYCWGGHDEGARVLLALRDDLSSRAQDPASPLFHQVNWNQVYYGGHSRGAASATSAAEFDQNARGLVLLQGTDARGDSFIGYTDRWDDLPELPVIHLAAEQDNDVSFPVADRLLERYGSSSTLISIYGGCHDYSATIASTPGCLECDWNNSTGDVDNCRYISRAKQQEWTKHFCLAFLKRHAYGDLSIENMLYGDEYEGSSELSLAYHRNLGDKIIADNFDNHPFNQQGQLNTFSGFAFVEVGSCYDVPFPFPPALEPITNLILHLPNSGTSVLSIPLGTLQNTMDVTEYKQLHLRLKNHDIPGLADNSGYSFVQINAILEDSLGNTAQLALDSHLPQAQFHPNPEPASVQVEMKYQRYISLNVNLSEFLAQEPSLDISQLTLLRFEFITQGQATVPARIGLDDVLFE